MRDTLTGVGNRRWFDEEAAKLLAAEASYPCSLMLVDTDFFKEVNDTFGHPVGDEVLRVVAAIVAEVTAKVKRGCCARIGGDEFGAIWPRTNSEEAILLAESTRSRLAQREFPDARRVTVSIGVVAARNPISLLELIRRADAALYRAKIAGRNEVHGD
jgi:diguanylate cyclase (GGDEF)-like protein